MSVVRFDTKGLLVIAGGYRARPGDVAGYSHVYDMSDGGLKVGQHVKARHVAGTPLTKIKLSDGRVLHWHHEKD